MPRPSRLLTLTTTAAALAFALSACGSSPSTSSPAAVSTSAASSASGTGASAGATVRTASTSLGTVVVDAKGRTLYMFTKDTKGTTTSACTGQCLTTWPPLTITDAPTADGVSGTLATIATADGKKQVTLDGWPLYYFAKDAAPGDVKGQNVGSVWFVVDASGTPVTATASASGKAY